MKGSPTARGVNRVAEFPSRSCRPQMRRRSGRSSESAMTLLELVAACAILLILAAVALPLERVTIIRHRERDLHDRLHEMRDAIDRYKDYADRNLITVQAGTEGYPPDLQTLVTGVQLTGAQDKHIRFLREIPMDPMTKSTDWGLRSVQDDSDSTSWGGQDVFDVYSRSTDMALDGTKYSDW